MTTLKEGDRAPSFSLPDADGQKVSLSGFKGKRVVLYFYPKDDTPGCTTEACGFRDRIGAIHKADAVVVGVSPDGAEPYQKFRTKYGLPFTLLCDVNKDTLKDYGVWVSKLKFGKQSMGVARTTFIIGPDGTIEKIYKTVKPEVHADEVVSYLNSKAA